LTADRRLKAMEESLSPTELVLRWLAEAHAYGSFEPTRERSSTRTQTISRWID